MENTYLKVEIENGIMLCVFKPDSLDIATTKACIATRLSFGEGVSYPTFIDITSIKSVSKESRDYFASAEGYKCITAAALLIDSSVNKIIGNFFLQINKPPIPTKLFNRKSDAVFWLQQFLNRS